MKSRGRRWRSVTIVLALILVILPAGILQAEESGANNLSMPVVLTDGGTVPMRIDSTQPENLVDADLVYADDGVTLVYPQKANSTWVADYTVNPLGADVNVNFVDWGDNLEAKPWPDKSQVRVETVLTTNLPTPLNAYEMLHIYGTGVTELWGTTGDTYESNTAHVYTDEALLTIQFISPTATYTWDTLNTEWSSSGALAPVVYEGPATAEVNIQGKVVYGYNWNLITNGMGPGLYRITFSVPDAADASLEQAVLVVPVEEDTLVVYANPGNGKGVPGGNKPENPGSPPPGKGKSTGGGVAVVDNDNNLTYIDVTITAAKGNKQR